MGRHQKVALPIHGNEERVAKIIAELVRQGVGFKATQDNGLKRIDDQIVIEFTGNGSIRYDAHPSYEAALFAAVKRAAREIQEARRGA